MPKLYEYLGIAIFFWSNEHEPIHVHGEYQGREIRAEIIVQDGQIIEIRINNVNGRKAFEPAERKLFLAFVTKKSAEIVQKWVDYFVFHKKISCERITKREE